MTLLEMKASLWFRHIGQQRINIILKLQNFCAIMNHYDLKYLTKSMGSEVF